MLRPLRFRRLWLALAVLMVGAMVVGGLVPREPGSSMPGIDKLQHLLAWAGLSAWFGSMFERRAFPVLAVCMVALGIGIEFAQELMDLGRQGDWRDVVANTLGVATGMLAVALSGESWLERLERWLPAT